MTKKLLSLFLALAMVMSLSVTAFAAEEDINVIELDPEAVVFAEEVIGTPADQTGEILEDDNANTRASGVLFSMTANQVYNLLTTYNSGSKYFWGQDVKWDEAIQISGTVYMSQGSNYKIKVGVCYYNPSTDTFVSVNGGTLFTSGVNTTYFIEKYPNGGVMSTPRFVSQEKYYGHITNLYSSGYAYGTLTFSLIPNPNVS